MRILLIFTSLLFVSAPAHSAGVDRPMGKNCDLVVPPALAGEEMNHGLVVKVFPRAKDIDSNYTGCQALLAPHEKNEWVTVALTEVVKGDPVRVWSAYQKDLGLQACRYKLGQVVKGDPARCPLPEFLILKSLAPGCVRKIKAAVAKHGLGAARAPECAYQ